MSERVLHPEQAPPRITALPYAYTAPLALVVAGGLLIHWGGLALTTRWSSATLALTHVGTLGFLTMVCLGVFPPLAAIAGDAPLPWPRATHLVYYALVAGVVGLTWGVAHAQAAPVFFAIGAVGVMGVVFLAQGVAALRRARVRGPTVRGLRVALWSFFLAASLGIWLAHGHGGMRFPGPRPLWLQIHLTVALAGWIGGMIAALGWEVVPALLGGRAVDERAARWVGRAIVVGVTAPALLLLAQFAGVVREDAAALPLLLTVTSLPAVVVVWVVQPWLAWRSLRGVEGSGALLYFRTGLVLAPVVLVAGAAALLTESPRVELLFGWITIAGWAGSSVAGVLIAVVPLVMAAGEARRGAGVVPAAIAHATPAVHVLVLAVGAIAIVLAWDALARLAGALAVADGALLLAAIRSACRGPERPPLSTGGTA